MIFQPGFQLNFLADAMTKRAHGISILADLEYLEYSQLVGWLGVVTECKASFGPTATVGC